MCFDLPFLGLLIHQHDPSQPEEKTIIKQNIVATCLAIALCNSNTFSCATEVKLQLYRKCHHITFIKFMVDVQLTTSPGTVDQKNPLQSGSSNMYGMTRVKMCTQLRTKKENTNLV